LKSSTRNISSYTTTYSAKSAGVGLVVRDYTQLVKLNLTLIVVLTALGSFVIASGLSFGWYQLITLALGGFCITSASNALNEVLEKDYDRIMSRTKDRPLVTGRISVSNAVLFAGMMCLAGITLLSFFNPLCGFLGMMSFVLYAFVYTPLKRYSSAAVFVGAIAGAMPMTIGVVAYTGEITLLAITLFLVQFFWQYPHFWAIAFKGHEDYRKAGFNFIPTTKEDKPSIQIGLSSVVMSIALLPTLAMLYWAGIDSVVVLGLLGLFTLGYILLSIRFYKYFDSRSSLHLMLGSFAYIPAVLFTIIIGLI